MIRTEILKEIKKLSPRERLRLIESAVRQLQEDVLRTEKPPTSEARKRQLSVAAKKLRTFYEKDPALTSFTALDGEDFHA